MNEQTLFLFFPFEIRKMIYEFTIYQQKDWINLYLINLVYSKTIIIDYLLL